jgi:hypothetical protein
VLSKISKKAFLTVSKKVEKEVKFSVTYLEEIDIFLPSNLEAKRKF